MAGCGGFSFNSQSSSSSSNSGSETSGDDGSDRSSSSSQSSAPDGASGSDSEALAHFAELKEEDNKNNAREFKDKLREMWPRYFGDADLFALVESDCGVKIWDVCEVINPQGNNDLGYPRWAYRKKGDDTIKWFPDIAYHIGKEIWTDEAIAHVRKEEAEKAEELLDMVKKTCGDPINTNCTVMRSYTMGEGYYATHNETGEVIKMMGTLREWLVDM